MAETNQTNPYAGATQVTADPYAGSVPVTQDPYAGAIPVTEEKKDDFSITKEMFNIVVGGARNVAAGVLSNKAFYEKISPTNIGAAIGKAIKDGDASALDVLNKALEKPTGYEIASNMIAAPESMRPKSTLDIGLPDVTVGKKEIPLGFKDVPVGEFAQDLGQYMGAYGAVTKGANLLAGISSKSIPEIVKQTSKVIGAGVAAEQFAFSPYEERLSNLIQETIPNQFTEFLAADPDDNEALARFKMAIEGAAISIPVEGLFRFAGKLRANKQAQEIQPVDVPENKVIDIPDQLVKTEAITSGPYAGANVVSPMSVAEAKAQKQAERLAKRKNPFKVNEETGVVTAKIKGKEVEITKNAENQYEATLKDAKTDQEINDALENLQIGGNLSPDEITEATKLLKQEKVNRPIKTYASLEEAKVDITKTFDPGILPKSLRPTTEPKTRKAQQYITRKIDPGFYRATELINGLNSKSGRLPPWVLKKGGAKDFDEIQEMMEQDGFFPPREVYEGEVPDLSDDIIDAIAENRIHQSDAIAYEQWKQTEARKLEKIDQLEQNGYDPLRMSDADVEQAFKKIDEQDAEILAEVDRIEKENIAKRQTDEIYQQTMAREKSLSMSEEDLVKIRPADELPPSYTPKDYGFDKRPPRVPPSQTPPGESIPDDKFAGNINLDKINEPDDIKDMIRKIAKDNGGFEDARRGVVKFGSKGENLEALARALNLTDETLLKRKIGQAYNSEELYAANILFDEALRDAQDLSRLAQSADATQIDIFKYDQAMARLASIQEQIAGIRAEAGRTLRAAREIFGPAASKNPKIRDKLIQDYINLKGGTENIQDIARKMSMLNDPAAVAKFARDMYTPRFIDYAQEYWINALLSSPSTHIVNTLSNTLVAGLTPLEYFGASVIGAVTRRPDRITFGESGARLLGSIYGALDGVRAAGKAIIDGEAVDPMTKLELGRQKAIPGPLGKLIRVPGTALVAEDAFFKSIGYRQEMWGQAFRAAEKEGKGIKRAYELMRNPESLDPKVHLDAIEAGRYQTFTKPLDEGILGKIGKGVQGTVAEYPVFRFMVPFIRTPVNIVQYAFERLPGIGAYTAAYKKAKAQGGKQYDLAKSKLAIGSAISAGVFYYAWNNQITGRGPSDPRERSVMLETGWQPYSIKVGDKYYSYNRFEPVGILFGVTADMADIGKYISEQRELSEEETLEYGRLGSMIAASFSENITNKSFLTGLSDTIEMINDPDRYAERTVRRFFSSFVPTALYYERKSDDPIIRDVQSTADAFANRLPEIFSEFGFKTSKDLPARRNVFGEIKTYKETLGGRYSPINISAIKNDVAFNEFVKLGYIPPLPKRQIGDVKLTPVQYEQLLATQEYLGLRDKIEKFIKLPAYKFTPKSKKIEKFDEYFRTYQTQARELLVSVYPDITRQETEQRIKEAKE